MMKFSDRLRLLIFSLKYRGHLGRAFNLVSRSYYCWWPFIHVNLCIDISEASFLLLVQAPAKTPTRSSSLTNGKDFQPHLTL